MRKSFYNIDRFPKQNFNLNCKLIREKILKVDKIWTKINSTSVEKLYKFVNTLIMMFKLKCMYYIIIAKTIIFLSNCSNDKFDEFEKLAYSVN